MRRNDFWHQWSDEALRSSNCDPYSKNQRYLIICMCGVHRVQGPILLINPMEVVRSNPSINDKTMHTSNSLIAINTLGSLAHLSQSIHNGGVVLVSQLCSVHVRFPCCHVNIFSSSPTILTTVK